MLSELETAWRAWQGLNERDRLQFLNRFREAHRQEREERLFANGRVARLPVNETPYSGLDVAALDFGARPDR